MVKAQSALLFWVAKDVGEDILESRHATVSSKANFISNEQWCIVL